MPRIETEITELATALGALGYDLGAGLLQLPPEIVNVPLSTWDRLRSVHQAGQHRLLFATAWANGRAFLLAKDGLRGRIPIRIEWKGPDRQVERDPIPADLRIDSVFLVSVKTRSAVLWNRSPSQVFARTANPIHWYAETAADEYQALYEAAVAHSGLDGLARQGGGTHPRPRPGDGSNARHAAMAGNAPAALPNVGAPVLCPERPDLERLRQKPVTEGADAWWLLRLAPAPYYLLGDATRAPLRIRVDTPWDWRQTWHFEGLDIIPAAAAGQPQVEWALRARHRETGETRHANGYVEVRWSHGRFSGHPEAKVQLRTPYEQVPGYTSLT